MDGNVLFVVQPSAEFREQIAAADEREFASFGNKQVKFARTLIRSKPARSGGRNCLRFSGRMMPVSPKRSDTLLPSPVTTTLWCISPA
jgi:hypothetical protein